MSVSAWMLIDHGADDLADLRHVQIHVFGCAGAEPKQQELQQAMVDLLGRRPPSDQLREARLTLVPLQEARNLGTWRGELMYRPASAAAARG